jgi:hypothetical protein
MKVVTAISEPTITGLLKIHSGGTLQLNARLEPNYINICGTFNVAIDRASA